MGIVIISIWLMALLTGVFGGATINLLEVLSNGNDEIFFLELATSMILLFVVSFYIPNLIYKNIAISQLLTIKTYYDRNKEPYPYIRIDRELSNQRGNYHKIFVDSELVYIEPEWRVRVPLKVKMMIAKKIRFHNKENRRQRQISFDKVMDKILKGGK